MELLLRYIVEEPPEDTESKRAFKYFILTLHRANNFYNQFSFKILLMLFLFHGLGSHLLPVRYLLVKLMLFLRL